MVHATEAMCTKTSQVKWGADLQSEHERYLTEVAFSGNPVIVTDYPKVLFCYTNLDYEVVFVDSYLMTPW